MSQALGLPRFSLNTVPPGPQQARSPTSPGQQGLPGCPQGRALRSCTSDATWL